MVSCYHAFLRPNRTFYSLVCEMKRPHSTVHIQTTFYSKQRKRNSFHCFNLRGDSQNILIHHSIELCLITNDKFIQFPGRKTAFNRTDCVEHIKSGESQRNLSWKLYSFQNKINNNSEKSAYK